MAYHKAANEDEIHNQTDILDGFKKSFCEIRKITLGFRKERRVL